MWRQGSQLQLGSSPQRSQPLCLRVSTSQRPRPRHQQDTDGRGGRKLINTLSQIKFINLTDFSV